MITHQIEICEEESFEHFLNTQTVMKSSKPLSISICDYSKRFDSGLRHFYLENYHVCGSSLFCSEKNIKVQHFPKSESVADFFGKI